MTSMQENVGALIRELASSMKALPGARPDYVPPSINPLASLEAKYRDKPLPALSAELRRKLGLPPNAEKAPE